MSKTSKRSRPRNRTRSRSLSLLSPPASAPLPSPSFPQPLPLLSLQLPSPPRELSRVSQVPISCASFWQGLRFAIQKHFGRVAASGASIAASVAFCVRRARPGSSSSSTSFSARRIPRRSRCHLLLMPSSLPPLPRCSCAVLPHPHRAAPTFPSPLVPSDAAALDVAVAAAVAQAVATAVGRYCRRRCHHPRSQYVLFVWCAGDLMRSWWQGTACASGVR